MVSNNQLEQCFQFVKDMPLEEVISEPFMHSVAYYIYQNLPFIQGLVRVLQLYNRLNKYLWYRQVPMNVDRAVKPVMHTCAYTSTSIVKVLPV